MYPKKVPKCEKPDTSWYTIHHCHDTPGPILWNNRIDYYDIASIDPGRRNFAIRIERRNIVTSQITTLAFEKIDLIGKDVEDVVMAIDSMYSRINNFLNKYLELLQLCHLIIIERQLHINYKMVRFSQHVISYLTIYLKNAKFLPIIMEINNKLKTHQLQAPKGLSDKDVKKWAIAKADELLRMRKDQVALDIISASKKKKDDLSDTVVQIESVFSLFDLPLTQENPVAKINISTLAKPLAIPPKSASIDLSTLVISKLKV